METGDFWNCDELRWEIADLRTGGAAGPIDGRIAKSPLRTSRLLSWADAVYSTDSRYSTSRHFRSRRTTRGDLGP
ncbi:hypothetical protein IMZ48_39305 [Candidatus Bathyarchaeota archaeon]|nr:hypothetical protein [Candidatus Bathyarchaeota archaeon]